jgi:predicted nucleic acid-binding protein
VGTVVLDANVIIAVLLEADALHETAIQLLASTFAGNGDLIVPASVHSEILVGPMRVGAVDVVEGFLADNLVTIAPINAAIARAAAGLRAKHASLRLPDAFVLATAQQYHAGLLTLDIRLRRLFDAQQQNRTGPE